MVEEEAISDIMKEENLENMEEKTKATGTAGEVTDSREIDIRNKEDRDQDLSKGSQEERQSLGERRELLPKARTILNRYMTFITHPMMIM